MMAAPVLLVGAPLVLADVYLRKPEPTVEECRVVLAKAARRPAVLAAPKAAPVTVVASAKRAEIRPAQSLPSIFSPEQVAASLAPPSRPAQKPAMSAAIVGTPKLVPTPKAPGAPVRTANARPTAPVAAPTPARPARVAALGRTAPLPRGVAAPASPLSCAGQSATGLACGSAAAQKPAIQAQLSYNRLNTRCAGVISAYGRGGLEGAMIYAMTASQQSARNAGAAPDVEEAQVKRALQKALSITGSPPKDVLAALSSVEAAYGGCPGYDTARNALRSTVALVQSELQIDQPTATPGFGAALANPGLPSAGSLGTASYSTTIVR
jgi:hypothetical protein